VSATVRPSLSQKRPWAVESNGKLVELHATEEAAQAGADRINRVCRTCRTPHGLHTPECPLSRFEPDPGFGAEIDGDDT
jgi:hypothetical protein